MSKKTIEETILFILGEKLGQSSVELFKDKWDESVFGKRPFLSTRDMVYLCYFLEQEYGVSFNGADFSQDEFYTLGGLSRAVRQKLREPAYA